MAKDQSKTGRAGVLRKALRRGVGWLGCLAVVMASPAYAGVEGEMQSFMSDMGVSANVTGPVAYQGQSAGYYSMGSVWARFPQKNIQPFNLQLPHARAGCGGIDLFAGSFSFINSAELIAMLKATANNALGFAFKLAIDTISPEIGKVMDELAQKVQQMNQMNISSCETAQALVGGLWPKSDTASATICESIANAQGIVADWAKGRQNCNNGGQRDSIRAGNSDPDMAKQAGMPQNYTWEALKGKYSGFDENFREFLMTLVGTVIYDPNSAGTGKPLFRSIPGADATIVTAFLDGTSTAAQKVWQCDEPVKCMNPTQVNMVIGPSAAIKPRVRELLMSMRSKIRNPSSQLTAQEQQLIGMASIPVYKMMVVAEAAEFGLSPSDINDMAEIVSVDLVTTMTMRFINMTLNSQHDFQGADADSLHEWREGLYRQRDQFMDLATNTSQRFDHTLALIQKTQFLERTLKSQMSPGMAGAMRFSRTLSQQLY